MTNPHLVAINSQIDAFPALPATVTKVMAVTADPESCANDLMQAILPDPTMCSAVLKVANSAFFGVPRKVSTIERAVVVLGFEEIRNIVIGKAIFTSFPKMTRESRSAVGLFWEHAFTCGLAAKIIGEHLHISPSELFIAGLIHDIGKLAMFLAFPNEYPILRELSAPSHYNNISEEERSFATRHDRVGLQLAEKWLLPHRLTMAIGYHHKPQEAPSCRHYPLIIQASDILALMYGTTDTLKAEDVMKIFNDFFPEAAILWRNNHLPWNLESLGMWFEALKQSRKSCQNILNIFSAP
jgi:HD-like signal output (HDOD) protein